MKVKYIGASDAQVRWGNCDDPRDALIEGVEYEVEKEEAHTWHTKLYLVGIKGRFNSACFDFLGEAESVFLRLRKAVKELFGSIAHECQHEKLNLWDDPNVSLFYYRNESGTKKVIINVCKKCRLLYAEVPDESR